MDSFLLFIFSRLRQGATRVWSFIRIRATGLWSFIVEDFWSPRLAKIAVEFCVEAAVLIAVFPILDTIIKGGIKDVTRSLIGWSIGLPALLLLFAGVITAIIRDDGED
jgi:hypothetical protein